jgi:hypothetical protein
MQAAYHWDVLANDVANQINNELIVNDYLDSPVYVRATCGDEDTPCQPHLTTPFNEAFRDLLITELVQFGVPVRQQLNDDSIVVHYKVQLVYHDALRIRTIKPGLLTMLATGIMVFRNAPHEFRTIATAGLLDIVNQNALRGSNHEVVITTSMVVKDQYLFRTSDIYYINDRDFSHYNDTSPQLSEIQLIGPRNEIMQNEDSNEYREVAPTPPSIELPDNSFSNPPDSSEKRGGKEI